MLFCHFAKQLMSILCWKQFLVVFTVPIKTSFSGSEANDAPRVPSVRCKRKLHRFAAYLLGIFHREISRHLSLDSGQRKWNKIRSTLVIPHKANSRNGLCHRYQEEVIKGQKPHWRLQQGPALEWTGTWHFTVNPNVIPQNWNCSVLDFVEVLFWNLNHLCEQTFLVSHVNFPLQWDLCLWN